MTTYQIAYLLRLFLGNSPFSWRGKSDSIEVWRACSLAGGREPVRCGREKPDGRRYEIRKERNGYEYTEAGTPA